MSGGSVPYLLPHGGEGETIGLEEYRRRGGYEALRKAVRALSPLQVKQVVADSGLRGHGGAGFPTGRKWMSLREDAPHPRYLIANTDEMEPGTFKDRVLVSVNPHAVIEGMIIAGYAGSVRVGYFFVRPSYEKIVHGFEKALSEAREEGFLGEGIVGGDYSFDIVVHRSAGRYICGETKGLVHALEGKRPHPNIEGHLTEAGLWGCPTLVDNVETLAHVPAIVRNGAGWFRSAGRHEHAPGHKVYSVSGWVKHPGAFELPFGTPLSEIIEKHAGGMKRQWPFKACLPGGASTRYLSKKDYHAAMDFDSVQEIGRGHHLGTGAIVVFDQQTCLVAATLNMIRFFSRESCGWCTPCREGLPYMEDLLRRIEDGEGKEEYISRLCEMSVHMHRAYCAFAPGAVAPVEALVQDFSDEVREHLNGKGCPFRD
ncbi:MAG: NADH-ubiquinone oxidoreductase-F iron-sulfur binding region domain-containing protein [Thermodesulfobacteriota bacterium]